MIWNADPQIFGIGPLTIRWYGLMFLISFVLGYRLMRYFFREKGIADIFVDHLFTYVFLGTLIGARLGHCLFYEPEIYLHDPIRIFKVWEGGLASHGAAIGIFIALVLYTRKYQLASLLWLVDRIAIGVAQAAVLVRIGNFFNSEIVGRPTDVPWAIVFARIDNQPRHPTQIYEALCYLVTFLLLIVFYKKKSKQVANGYFFGIFLMMIFGSRFCLEFLKENQVSFENGLPLNMGQMLSAPLVIAGIALFLRNRKKEPDAHTKTARPKRPS